MASNIENLAEKTAKLSIDPIYETNWCDMPVEVKLECIERMDFKERLSLRCTAKAEKSLADSQKMDFSEALIFRNYITVASNKTSLTKMFKDEKIWLSLMQYVLKIGVFDKISFLVGNKLNNYIDDFLTNCTEMISAKNIDFGDIDMKTAIVILEKLKDGVESIGFNAHNRSWFSLDDVLLQSKVQNASYCQIKNLMFLGCVQKVAQMWIDKDSKIGTTFQVSVVIVINGPFGSFATDLADRIPEQFFDPDSDDSRYDDYYGYDDYYDRDYDDNEDIFGRHVDDIDEDWHGNYYM
ncbi:Protein CBG24112 [Caenorhabditis briggsae]|uniref:Protein CBG24112 n=1 Tax=Caenorhabditis briggsae TaxID=6238 RepID=A8WK06_CAEBR|nr:Protein CBG24112 [Caenorhabditis briggsae]CAP20799.2 Protein CBG24112 [Caenorhabditis briggsae]